MTTEEFASLKLAGRIAPSANYRDGWADVDVSLYPTADDNVVAVDDSAVVEVVFADGIWCHDCQYFETVDSIVGARCMGCGCPATNHVSSKVVRA
jgi:hypothetical protein